MLVQYLILILLAYLMGSSNMAYYLSRAKQVDIRKNGSGNLGASNATVLFGWGAGVAVALHDIGKAVLAVLMAKWLFPQVDCGEVIAGVACVLGHIFPFYLRFRGGKGLASFLGMLAALNWKVALVLAVLLVIVTLTTDFIALGTISVSLAGPVALMVVGYSLLAVLILSVATVVMVFKHRDNIVRIRNRQEIGLLSTVKGENRVK